MLRLSHFCIKNKNINLDKLYEGFRKSLALAVFKYQLISQFYMTKNHNMV